MEQISDERIVNDVLKNFKDITCYECIEVTDNFTIEDFWFTEKYEEECIPRIIDYIKTKYPQQFDVKEPLPIALMDRLDTYFINKVRREHKDAMSIDNSGELEY